MNTPSDLILVTPSQTCGPLFGFSLMPPGIDKSVPENDPRAVVVEGRVLDHAGQHLGHEAFLEIWSPGQAVRVRTFDDHYRAVLARPAPIALPDGRLQAPHLHLMLHARGITRHLTTRLYFDDEAAANAADPVLALIDTARRPTLLARRQPAAATGSAPGYRFDIHLQGQHETVFFDTRLV